MGRTAPSIRVVLEGEKKKLERLAELLGGREGEYIKRCLEGLDDTLSLYTHAEAPLDPLEVLIFHLLVKHSRRECMD